MFYVEAVSFTIEGPYSSTDSVLKTLIGFVVKRGVLVTLIQSAFLIMFYVSSPHPYWYVESADVHLPHSRC